MTNYTRIEKQVKKEYEKKRKETEFYINRGFYPTWAEEHRNNTDRGIKEYSTAARWAAYQAGKLDRKKAVELATVRAFREIEKQEKKQLDKLTEAANAPELIYISISVEWTRSRTWGNIPHVEIRTNNGYYTGTASGCGYDKESAAIADALNDAPEVMKVLYNLKEKHPNTPHRDLFGYGSGYGILPYFEGGVGYSCFERIFEKCGFKCSLSGTGERFDCYNIEKKGKK